MGMETWERKEQKFLGYRAVNDSGTVFPWRQYLDIGYSQETRSFRGPRSMVPVWDPADFTKVTYDPRTADPYNRFDNGHEFFSKKTWRSIPSRQKRVFLRHPKGYTGSGKPALWDGLLDFSMSTSPGFTYPIVSPLSTYEKTYWGTKAIADSAPTKPSSSLSLALGELLVDGFPFAMGLIDDIVKRGLRLKQAGDFYLAMKFGLEPFIKDLVEICQSVSDAAKIIEQYERDSGRTVRRSRKFPPLTTTTKVAYGMGKLDNVPTSLSVGTRSGPVSLVNSIHEKVWFSGAFMYHSNRDFKVAANIQRLAKYADLVLGTNLSPEVLWNLAPWTWLVDWKLNVTDAMSNYTRFQSDELVLQYGYVMRQTSSYNTYTLETPLAFTNGYRRSSLVRSYCVLQKERYKATPFGFGLNPRNFTAEQQAILAALFLSKFGG